MSGDDDTRPTPLAAFRLTRLVTIQWAIVSAVGFFVFAYGFATLLVGLQGESLEPIVIPAGAPPDVLGGVAVLLAVIVLVVVPHELIHGLFMARYGASPEYGVGISYFVLPYAYAKTTQTYTRNQLLVILLAPLVLISAVGLALAALSVVPTPLVVVLLAANAAGSIGDLWMAALLIRYPPSVSAGPYPGETQGLAIYGPPDVGERTSSDGLVSTFIFGAVGTLTVLLATLFALVVSSLAFSTGSVVLGHPESRLFLFRHELVQDGPGAVIEVGGSFLLALAALGGLAWVLVSRAFRHE